jgi:hypothetical protein
MRTQEEREEQTLEIASALGLFVLVLAITAGGLAIVNSVVDVGAGLARAIFSVAALGGGFVALTNLLRATKR